MADNYPSEQDIANRIVEDHLWNTLLELRYNWPDFLDSASATELEEAKLDSADMQDYVRDRVGKRIGDLLKGLN